MAASCKAGMCFTPSFEAIQVVPQKKLTQHKARIGNPMEFILFEKAFCILVFAFTLETCFYKLVFQKPFDFLARNHFPNRFFFVIKLR
jgi:hypothetical protein